MKMVVIIRDNYNFSQKWSFCSYHADKDVIVRITNRNMHRLHCDDCSRYRTSPPGTLRFTVRSPQLLEANGRSLPAGKERDVLVYVWSIIILSILSFFIVWSRITGFWMNLIHCCVPYYEWACWSHSLRMNRCAYFRAGDHTNGKCCSSPSYHTNGKCCPSPSYPSFRVSATT